MTTNIRLQSHTWIRHYGGREITTKIYICKATLIAVQDSDQRYVVVLEEDCAGFKKGHKIAVPERDFNIQK